MYYLRFTEGSHETTNIEADDALEALIVAHDLVHDGAAQLWRDDQKVCHIRPGSVGEWVPGWLHRG
jgi:hypothetical protein